MRKLIAKLKSKKGESLVESMAAILIFTMASLVLYSMVTTAGDINGKAKEKDRANQIQMVGIEKGDPAVQNGAAIVTMTLESTGQEIAEVDVDIYGGKNEGDLYAYFKYVDPSTVPAPTESEGG